MAASLSIEEESGTYTTRIRHPHNGYYAGDFSQMPRSGPGLRASYAQRRVVLRATSQHGGHAQAASAAIPNQAEHHSQASAPVQRTSHGRAR
jgi:hypothetical protein